MNLPAPRASRLAALLCAGLGLWMAGCMAADDDRNDGPDMFPKPNGPKILPLEDPYRAVYRFVEFDSAMGEFLRLPELDLHVARRNLEPADSGLYGYAFENPDRGQLVRFLDTGNRDSAGVYIVGSFGPSGNVLDSSPALWLPQHPRAGVSWSWRSGQAMELVSLDAEYVTETLFPQDSAANRPSLGFQRHRAIHLRETAGDTVSDYYLRRGVGILGFERSVRGRLVAAGTLRAFLRAD